MRILVVEDESRIATDISAALLAAGYAPEVASDGEDAWFRGDAHDYDLVVLDLGLPRLDGLTVLKRWRAGGRHMPVLVLTARGLWAERVEGIDAGADDYLAKPFQMEELIARVRALIRRSAGHGAAVFEAGSLSLDTRHMLVCVEGVRVAVSPLEYRLLVYLLHQKGRVVSPGELIEHLYGGDDARDANSLEAIITRLRKKLGPTAIETRKGFGYYIPAASP
jgi:two-component system, OmpR family, response regulator